MKNSKSILLWIIQRQSTLILLNRFMYPVAYLGGARGGNRPGHQISRGIKFSFEKVSIIMLFNNTLFVLTASIIII